jgi:hypothetical protein
MHPTAQSTLSYLAAPPITPTLLHDSQADASAFNKQHHQNPLDLPDLSRTAPFRDGLPTPPNDMNGVAYSNIHHYGGKPDPYAGPVYGKGPAYPRVSADLLNRMTQQTQPSQPAQQPSKQVPPEKDERAKEKDASKPSYLQIPPSINNGKGNLPDFAAQVRILQVF